MPQSNADASELSVREVIRHFSAYCPYPRDPDEVIEAVGLVAGDPGGQDRGAHHGYWILDQQ